MKKNYWARKCLVCRFHDLLVAQSKLFKTQQQQQLIRKQQQRQKTTTTIIKISMRWKQKISLGNFLTNKYIIYQSINQYHTIFF